MNYRPIDEPEHIREQFRQRFLLTFDELVSLYADRPIESRHIDFTLSYYNRMFMWDRLRPGGQDITFDHALRLLREHRGEVIVMSDAPACIGYSPQMFGGLHDSAHGFAATADAAELAGRIEYEWRMIFELEEAGCIFTGALLPDDIYVFDSSFSWYIIFTHESYTLEATADDRLCIFREA